MREEQPPRLLPTLIIGAVALFVALTVIGWVVGAVLAVLRGLVVLAVVVLAGWALLRVAADR